MLLLVSVVAAGCRLDVTAVTDLDGDGSGTAALVLRLDDALLDELDELAIDPTTEVTAAATRSDGWNLERTVDDEQAITIRLEHPVTRPGEIGDAFRSLVAGLSEDDPALLIDIDVSMDDDGGASLAGDVGFRPPTTAGVVVDGDPVGPTSAEIRDRVDEMLEPRFEVTLPGPIVAHDADRVDGRTLSWAVPIDGSREVSATSDSPAIYEQPWLWAAVTGVLVLLGAVLLQLRRRWAARRRATGVAPPSVTTGV